MHLNQPGPFWKACQESRSVSTCALASWLVTCDMVLRVWCVLQAKYCVDEVHFTSDMAAVLQATQPPCLHMLAGTNTDRWAAVTTAVAVAQQQQLQQHRQKQHRPTSAFPVC